MKAKKITKPTLEDDTYLVAQAVNHNAEVLENALNRIKELEKRMTKEEVIAEIEEQEKWLAEAGYNAYNVDIAFGSIIRVLRQMC
jgi:hypothetical protein